MESIGEGVPGYVTPKVAIGAVVGNDEGEILLVQRADSGVWLYPTGWADVGYSPAEVAVKEVEEETGIHCEPVQRPRRDRRHADGLHPLRHVHGAVPLPGRRRRAAAPTRWRPPTSAGSPRTTCRPHRRRRLVGPARRSPPSAARACRWSSIRPRRPVWRGERVSGRPRTLSCAWRVRLLEKEIDDRDPASAALPRVADGGVVDDAVGVGRDAEGRRCTPRPGGPAPPRRRSRGRPRGRPTAFAEAPAGPRRPAAA